MGRQQQMSRLLSIGKVMKRLWTKPGNGRLLRWSKCAEKSTFKLFLFTGETSARNG
jgi:hypothetical protein